MPRNVAIVFNPDYASQLERLAFHTPVWIVETPENRAAAEAAWHAAIEWPHITVTLFRPPGEHPRKDDWRALFELILLQEEFDSVELIGTEMTVAVRAALAELGFDRFDETREGFRARRGAASS